MIVDSSALIAILLNEPDRASLVAKMASASSLSVSAASVLESAMVLEGNRGLGASADLDDLIRRTRMRIIPFDVEQLEIARKAFELYAKGRHPAGLNFGDCISYALAKWTGEALLFKGEDFTFTDVRQVG